MRKYRGLTKEGKWVYGWYFEARGHSYIISKNVVIVKEAITYIADFVEVIPETVGQFIGLKDKNGQEIYEGDIVLDHQISPSSGNIRAVEDLGDICWIFQDQENQDKNVYEVIGNRWENPELMEQDNGCK